MAVVEGMLELVHHQYAEECPYCLVHKLGVHKFAKILKRHCKILSARQVTRSNFHTQDPQILGATIQI
jgi:hypothetical protein